MKYQLTLWATISTLVLFSIDTSRLKHKRDEVNVVPVPLLRSYLWAVGISCRLLFRLRRLFVTMLSICTAGYIQEVCKVCAATTTARPSFKCIVKHWHSRVMATTTCK